MKKHTTSSGRGLGHVSLFASSFAALLSIADAQSVSNTETVGGITYTSTANVQTTGYPNVDTPHVNNRPSVGWDTSVTISGNSNEFGVNVGVADVWVKINSAVGATSADARWYGGAGLTSTSTLETPPWTSNTVQTGVSGGLNVLQYDFVDGRNATTAPLRYDLSRLIIPFIDVSGAEPLIVMDVYDTITNISGEAFDFSIGSYVDFDIQAYLSNYVIVNSSYTGGIQFEQFGAPEQPIITLQGENADNFQIWRGPGPGTGGRNAFFSAGANASDVNYTPEANPGDSHSFLQWNGTLADGVSFTTYTRYSIIIPIPEPSVTLLSALPLLYAVGRRRRM